MGSGANILSSCQTSNFDIILLIKKHYPNTSEFMQ